MKIITDGKGYVTSYAIVGDLTDGTEVAEPEDMDLFQTCAQAYLLKDGVLIYDEAKKKELDLSQQKEALRQRREKECFTVINRGQLWYERLTEEQRAELSAWYDDWLKVTDTMTVPDKPEWV